ncbi:MAG: WbqC family protein [Flavobacteriales bacterium]|nr:WbqC family protein [Flavobacteriales bacterium]
MESDIKENTIILPSAYFGSLEYWKLMASENPVLIDGYEPFRKQTLRNRTHILTPNGIQILSVPLQHRKNNTRLKDIKICYAENWQIKHWRSIVSAYNNSSYFEFYKDYFWPFYEKEKFRYLIDYNEEIQKILLKITKTDKQILFSNKPIEIKQENDFRKILSKKENTLFELKDYTHVFDAKVPQRGKLSILDLLCNIGPEARCFLKST